MIKEDINSVLSVRMTGCHRMHYGANMWQSEDQGRICQISPNFTSARRRNRAFYGWFWKWDLCDSEDETIDNGADNKEKSEENR